MIECFSIECQKYAAGISLQCFYITMLCDWLEKLTPLSQPIRNKTKTNCVSFACVLMLDPAYI